MTCHFENDLAKSGPVNLYLMRLNWLQAATVVEEFITLLVNLHTFSVVLNLRIHSIWTSLERLFDRLTSLCLKKPKLSKNYIYLSLVTLSSDTSTQNNNCAKTTVTRRSKFKTHLILQLEYPAQILVSLICPRFQPRFFNGLMGRGGVGVCSVPCNRRVAGSNLPQATAQQGCQKLPKDPPG